MATGRAVAIFFGLAACLSSCSGVGLFSRRNVGSLSPLGAQARQDPAISGNGRFLASVLEQGGKAMVVLQEQPGGQTVALRHLRGHEPHSSPSLSWNGRYIAALVQQGPQRVPILEDRATGKLLRLPLPNGSLPARLSLAPDGQRIAIEVMQAGQEQVQVFDLKGQLEPDLPGGLAVQGGGIAP
jgi:hypothetical protein